VLMKKAGKSWVTGIVVVDLTGRRFDRWLVLNQAPSRRMPCGVPAVYWLCRCDCGAEKEVYGGSLRNGVSRSCGCLIAEAARKRTQENNPSFKHGHTPHRNGKRSYSPTYMSWKAMRARCLNSNHPYYSYYGGRGVTITSRWLGEQGFENFLADMGKRPKGKTLDRFPYTAMIYSKETCRWATPHQQSLNQRKRRAA
jgi:hypothetical protein